MPIQRPVVALDTSHQLDLFPGGGDVILAEAEPPESASGVMFKRLDRQAIFLCGVRLDDYLLSMDQRDALGIRELLQEQDRGPFAARYQAGECSPYTPGDVGFAPVRDRERCQFVTWARRADPDQLGEPVDHWGAVPRHASLGRFIPLHEVSLTGDLVVELTRIVLKVTGSGVATVAGDGTVVQAAASNDHTIKLEAVRQAAQVAREKAQAEPEDPALVVRAERAEVVQATREQRTVARRTKGKSADGLGISPVEPEAVVTTAEEQKRPVPPPTSRACSPTKPASSPPRTLSPPRRPRESRTCLINWANWRHLRPPYSMPATTRRVSSPRPPNMASNCSAPQDGRSPTETRRNPGTSRIRNRNSRTTPPVTATAVRLARSSHAAGMGPAKHPKKATCAIPPMLVGRANNAHAAPLAASVAARSNATPAMTPRRPYVRPWPTRKIRRVTANARRWWNRSSAYYDNRKG